jgi:succinate-acetate transporter protein
MFIILKLSISVVVGLIFILAQKTLTQTKDKETKSHKVAFRILQIAFFSLAIFLATVVINNMLTLVHFFRKLSLLDHLVGKYFKADKP